MSVPDDPSMPSWNVGRKPARPPRPVQFSIRHVLVFVLAVSVLLALTTQLRHVGFAGFCFLAATALGTWRHQRRLTAASVTALLVYAITYLAFWVCLGYAPVMTSFEFTWARIKLQNINEAIEKYAEAEGEFPASLPALAKVSQVAVPISESGEILDPWNHPFHYRRTGDGFELACLGRDGQVGGVGLDADLYVGGPFPSGEMRLPWSQFLFETPGSQPAFCVALVAALFAGGSWFTRPIPAIPSTTSVVAAVVVTTIAAVVVAFFLGAFHVAAVQSGH